MPQTPDLTVKERELVESKLDRRPHESLGDAFERLVQGKDAEETQVNIESLINFVAVASACSVRPVGSSPRKR